MNRPRRFASIATCAISLFACAAPDETGDATDDMFSEDASACDARGAVRCHDGKTQTCARRGGGALAWTKERACTDPKQVCKANACVNADAAAVAQLSRLDAVVDFALDYHGWRGQVDEQRVREDAHAGLLLGSGKGETFFAVAQSVFRQAPAGHSGVYALDATTGSASCGGHPGDRVATSGASWHGVCTAVSGNDVVVTSRAPGANIDLRPGDTVVEVRDGAAVYGGAGAAEPHRLSGGASLVDALGHLPVCAPTMPFAAAQRDIAGASLLSLAKPGWVLRVRSTTGAMRSVTVPARLPKTILCAGAPERDAGDGRFAVSERSDGYLVVRLTSFDGTTAHPLPDPLTLEAYRAWITAWLSDLRAELAKHPHAPGLVWDVRGNGGGSQDLALALAMGKKAPAHRGDFYRCYARKPHTHPARFEGKDAGDDLTRVLPVPELDGLAGLFAWGGKQVVVTNGNTYSAADVFTRAAKAAGLRVVGRSGPGAFGSAAGAARRVLPSFVIDGVPIYAYASGWGCLDGAGASIEGAPPSLDVAVDLAADDLAAGRDTQIEAAVATMR